MKKSLFSLLVLGSLLFVGCAEKNITKDEMPKEPTASMDVYDIAITKSIKDCKEHNIILDEERTSAFMRKSPKKTIENAAKNEEKTPAKLCQFFADETSDAKIESVNAFTTKIIDGCQAIGVSLSKDGIHKKISTLPFFVIKQGLSLNKEATLEECQLMQKKYQ